MIKGKALQYPTNCCGISWSWSCLSTLPVASNSLVFTRLTPASLVAIVGRQFVRQILGQYMMQQIFIFLLHLLCMLWVRSCTYGHFGWKGTTLLSFLKGILLIVPIDGMWFIWFEYEEVQLSKNMIEKDIWFENFGY